MPYVTRRTAILGALAAPALAQPSWPQRPVRVIVPYAPGVGPTLRRAR